MFGLAAGHEPSDCSLEHVVREYLLETLNRLENCDCLVDLGLYRLHLLSLAVEYRINGRIHVFKVNHISNLRSDCFPLSEYLDSLR